MAENLVVSYLQRDGDGEWVLTTGPPGRLQTIPLRRKMAKHACNRFVLVPTDRADRIALEGYNSGFIDEINLRRHVIITCALEDGALTELGVVDLSGLDKDIDSLFVHGDELVGVVSTDTSECLLTAYDIRSGALVWRTPLLKAYDDEITEFLYHEQLSGEFTKVAAKEAD